MADKTDSSDYEMTQSARKDRGKNQDEGNTSTSVGFCQTKPSVEDDNNAPLSTSRDSFSGSGLRRVIPLAADLSCTYQPHRSIPIPQKMEQDYVAAGTNTQHSSRRIQLAKKKVLGWRTATPEPIEGCPPPPPPLTSQPLSDVESDLCMCVALVAWDHVTMDMESPTLSHIDDRQLEETSEKYARIKRILDTSSTLRYLRNGYNNYRELSVSGDVHRLSAYCCRSVRSKVFSSYKTITCRPKSWQSSINRSREPMTSDTDPQTSRTEQKHQKSDSPLYRCLVYTNQYMEVFSALTDFHHVWMTLDKRNGVFNALVVDKLWTYNHIHKVYLPYYRQLTGDSITDLFVHDITKMNNNGIPIKHVSFISTTNTLLFTNGMTLARRGTEGCSGRTENRIAISSGTRVSSVVETKEAQKQPHVRGEPSTSYADTEDAITSDLPLKKRRHTMTEDKVVVTPLEEASRKPMCGIGEPDDLKQRTRSSTSTSRTQAFVLRSKNWPKLHHQDECSKSDGGQGRITGPTVLDNDELRKERVRGRDAINPTLIVFKHNMDVHEPDTLLCYITAEIHLGNEIRY